RRRQRHHTSAPGRRRCHGTTVRPRHSDRDRVALPAGRVEVQLSRIRADAEERRRALPDDVSGRHRDGARGLRSGGRRQRSGRPHARPRLRSRGLRGRVCAGQPPGGRVSGPSGARGDTPEARSARISEARDARKGVSGPSGARGDTPEARSARISEARDARKRVSDTSRMRRRALLAALALMCLAFATWRLLRPGGEVHAGAGSTRQPTDASDRLRSARGGDEPAPLPLLLDDDPRGGLPPEGQVVDADAPPVGAAPVVLGSLPARTAVTEADGGFAFDGLVGRPYTLIARARQGGAGPITARLTS